MQLKEYMILTQILLKIKKGSNGRKITPIENKDNDIRQEKKYLNLIILYMECLRIPFDEKSDIEEDMMKLNITNCVN